MRISQRLKDFFARPLTFVSETGAEAGGKVKRWVAIVLTVAGLAGSGALGVANWDQLPAETRIAIEETAQQIGQQAFELRQILSPAEQPAQMLNYADKSVTDVTVRHERIELSDFTRATLSGVDFSGSTIINSRLTDVQIDKSRLTGAEIRGVVAHGMRFGADVQAVHTRISGMRGSNVVIDGSHFTFANISESTLTGTQITGADMRGLVSDWLDISGGSITGGQWTDAEITNGNWNNVTVADANMLGIAFGKSSLDGASFSGGNLDESEWRATSFTNGEITGTSLRDSRIYGGSWQGTTIRNVDFTGTIFDGTDFTGVKIDQAQAFDAHTLAGARNIDKAIIVDAAGSPIPGLMLSRSGVTERPTPVSDFAKAVQPNI